MYDMGVSRVEVELATSSRTERLKESGRSGVYFRTSPRLISSCSMTNKGRGPGDSK